MKTIIALGFVLGLAGCTDTDIASFSAIGSAAHVKCFSGGEVIIDTYSTGKVQNAEHSDGYEFKDSKSGKLVRVSADCIVEN